MPSPTASPETPRWARWALIAITLAAGAARLPGLTAEEPWFDEVFTLVLASQDLTELWRRTLADETNPPGLYLLLWGWIRLGGHDLAWVRLLPALASTLTVPAIALAARATGLRPAAALVAAVLAAASPLMLAMASEARAYAPLALVTTLTLAAAGRKRLPLVALGSVAMVSLHYFGALAVAAIAVALLWAGRARLRRVLPAVLGATLPAALALGAWLLLVRQAAAGDAIGQNAGWITPPGPRGLLSFGSQVIGTFGTLWGALAVASLLLAALVVVARARAAAPEPEREGADDEVSSSSAPLALMLALLPVLLVGLLGAVLGRELWVARYLIITLPGWWIIVADAATRTPTRWRAAAIAALVGWSLLAGIDAELARTRRTAWSLVARAFTAGGPRTVCTNEAFVALPLQYQALQHRLPLTVLDLEACVASRAPGAIILRTGTEGSLELLARRGATVGPLRDLGTSLPTTRSASLRWTD